MAFVVDKAILNKPAEKHWITYIKQRINKNKNFLGFISGQTGSGKSWSSIAICEQLDPDFNIENIIFDGLELMELINSGKLKKGSCICFEEAGVGMSNKNWQSVTNKMINYLLQTFRHKNFIMIMNSPFMDFVDASTRKLFHAEILTAGINTQDKTCKLKPQLIQYNGRYRKFYYKRLKVVRAEGMCPISFWNVERPSAQLIKDYEQKKNDYTAKLNQKIYSELQSLDGSGKKRKIKLIGELTLIQKETLDMLKQGMTREHIALKRGKDITTVHNTIELLRNKGYKLEPVMNGRVVMRYNIEEPPESLEKASI